MFIAEDNLDSGDMLAQGSAHTAPRAGDKVILHATHNEGKEQIGVYEVVYVLHHYNVVSEEQMAAWEERHEAGVAERFRLPLSNLATVVVRFLGKGDALKIIEASR